MTSQQGLNSLATIIKRLEAATSRLEDVAHHNNSPQTHTKESSTVITPTPTTTTTTAPQHSNTPAITAFEINIIAGALADYITKSQEIGGPVAEHAQLVSTLNQAQLSYLKLASASTKPKSQDVQAKLLSSIQEALKNIGDFKDKASRGKEGRNWANHLSTVGEGAGAWGWVAVEPTPAPYIGEMKDSAQFWANRVIKEFKETDKKHVAWAKSFVDLLDALQTYVKQYHTTGVTWNPKGQDPTTFDSNSTSTSTTTTPSPPTDSTNATPSAGPGGSNFLSQLNQGGSVTSGLKKVDASQMTHKNPSLRSGSTVADKAPGGPAAKPKPAALAAKKPAKTELDGTKWIVEYHENAEHVVIEQTELNHTVHLFGCKNTVIEIKGKVNAISAVNCTKTSILLTSVVSQLSITSSPSFTIQILGTVPTIQIDNTDSGSIYLSKECVESVEIITSKTSAININVPGKEEFEYEERAVPEQMKSVVRGGKVETSIVEHSG